MNKNFQNNLARSKEALENAEAVLIGGGAGLSASAGLLYGGKRFQDNFPEHIKKYGLTDMYSSGFYPFKTQEEKWAYWSIHIKINRIDPKAEGTYLGLKQLVEKKPHFIITTNVDGLFYKAGFDSSKVFMIQGDYGKTQCEVPCHEKLYDIEQEVLQMVKQQKDCKIPTELVPKCPVCGRNMEINIRKDGKFLEDDHWNQSNYTYQQFLSGYLRKKLVLLELGVGYNTPSIIKFPFEHFAASNPETVLIRINRDHPESSLENRSKTIVFQEDIARVISELSRYKGG